MSQYSSRATRRFCKRHGHLPKTSDTLKWFCARCGIELDALEIQR